MQGKIEEHMKFHACGRGEFNAILWQSNNSQEVQEVVTLKAE